MSKKKVYINHKSECHKTQANCYSNAQSGVQKFDKTLINYNPVFICIKNGPGHFKPNYYIGTLLEWFPAPHFSLYVCGRVIRNNLQNTF